MTASQHHLFSINPHGEVPSAFAVLKVNFSFFSSKKVAEAKSLLSRNRHPRRDAYQSQQGMIKMISQKVTREKLNIHTELRKICPFYGEKWNERRKRRLCQSSLDSHNSHNGCVSFLYPRHIGMNTGDHSLKVYCIFRSHRNY